MIRSSVKEGGDHSIVHQLGYVLLAYPEALAFPSHNHPTKSWLSFKPSSRRLPPL